MAVVCWPANTVASRHSWWPGATKGGCICRPVRFGSFKICNIFNFTVYEGLTIWDGQECESLGKPRKLLL